MSDEARKVIEFYTASEQQQIRQIEEMLNKYGLTVDVSIEKEPTNQVSS